MPNRRSSLLGRIRLIGKTVQSGLRLQKSNMKSLSSSDFEKSPDSPLKKRTSLSLSIKSSKSATSMSEKQSEMIKMHQNELGQKLSLDSLQRQKSPEEAKKIVPTSSRAATKKSVVIVTPGTISEGKSSSSLISSEENDLSEIPYVLSPRSTSLRIPTPQQSELNSGKQSFSDSLSFPTPPTVERIQTIDIHKPIALLPQSKSASYSNVSISELIPEIHTRANSLPDTNESVTNEESSEWYPKPALRKKPSYRFSLSKVPSIPAFDDLIIADSFDVDSIASSTDEDINVKPKDSQLLHSLNSPTQSILDIPEVVEYSQPTEIKPKATLAEANSQTLTSSWESVQTQAHADIISTETQTVRVSIKQAELEDFSCQTEDALVPILYACYSFGCRQGDHCYSSSCPNRPQLAHCARCLEHDEETETRVEFLKFENVRLLQELSALTLMVQTARSQTQQMQILKEAAESRFEQLARVAHRKLVRAMVDNRT